MNESDYEKILDGRIQRRLAADSAYRNAESAEEQSTREERVSLEEELRLVLERLRAIEAYGWVAIDPWPLEVRRDELTLELEQLAELEAAV